MSSKQNRKFKSKRVQHDNRNKWIKNINKAYIISCKCKGKFDFSNVTQIKSGTTINVGTSIKI